MPDLTNPGDRPVQHSHPIHSAISGLTLTERKAERARRRSVTQSA